MQNNEKVHKDEFLLQKSCKMVKQYLYEALNDFIEMVSPISNDLHKKYLLQTMEF